MAEFEEQIGQILSNPDAMSQIMRIANSLSGGAETAPGDASGGADGETEAPEARPAPSPGTPTVPVPAGPGDAGSPLLRRLLPILAEGQRDTDARRALYALRPYLNPRRQEKVERALQLARLYRMGKRLLSEWEG